jgi:isopentenyldiphosphate isomerase
MEEQCIVIDENDVPLRAGTKKECPTHPLSVNADDQAI